MVPDPVAFGVLFEEGEEESEVFADEEVDFGLGGGGAGLLCGLGYGGGGGGGGRGWGGAGELAGEDVLERDKSMLWSID